MQKSSLKMLIKKKNHEKISPNILEVINNLVKEKETNMNIE